MKNYNELLEDLERQIANLPQFEESWRRQAADFDRRIWDIEKTLGMDLSGPTKSAKRESMTKDDLRADFEAYKQDWVERGNKFAGLLAGHLGRIERLEDSLTEIRDLLRMEKKERFWAGWDHVLRGGLVTHVQVKIPRELVLAVKKIFTLLEWSAEQHPERPFLERRGLPARCHSAIRHLNEYVDTVDAESGRPHLEHAAAQCLLALWEMEQEKV